MMRLTSIIARRMAAHGGKLSVAFNGASTYQQHSSGTPRAPLCRRSRDWFLEGGVIEVGSAQVAHQLTVTFSLSDNQVRITRRRM